MGCCVSRIDRQEMVSRCRARKRYMKHLVQARQSLSVAHSFYLRSLRSTGSSLLQFATGESALHLHHHISPSPPSQLPLPPTPPPPPSMSPSTDTWTTTTSTTTTSALPPPPPPPPPVAGSTWDFWDPFVPSSAPRSGTEEEEWEEEEVATTTATTTTTRTAVRAAVRAAANVAAPPSVVSGFSKESEMAVVVSRQGKELVEIIKELDEYFLRAADAGGFLSGLLEVPTFSNHHLSSSGKVYNYGKSMIWSPVLWGSNSIGKVNGFGFWKPGEEIMVGGMGMGMGMGNGGVNAASNNGNNSHCSTVERLYAWEKKLFHEVKNAEKLKMEHEKRVEQVRRMEVKRANYMKTEKTKKEVEKLESQMEVASQAIHSTSDEIIKIREAELYPQLLDLVKGFMCMWRSMYESHQVQTHIVDQLKFLNIIPSSEPTSEIHRQSTLQLEMELQQWHQSFCNLVKAQRDYIHSLTGWLRLSLFQFNKNPLMRSVQDSTIYSLCEEWQVAIDNTPDKVASEGIKSLLTVIHAIVVQQAEELKQKKKSEAANKELEKKAAELRSLETKYGPYSMPETSATKNPVGEKCVKVEMLKTKAEEEKGKHEKAVSVTRQMTLNNMQMALPHVFQAITGFSRVCMDRFESVYSPAKNVDQEHDVKRLMMA